MGKRLVFGFLVLFGFVGDVVVFWLGALVWTGARRTGLNGMMIACGNRLFFEWLRL